MNKQLAKTLNSISQRLPKLIRGLEKLYGIQAVVTIEKIDRSLLLTQGEIQKATDFTTMTVDPSGLERESYISCYFCLFKSELTAIPTSETSDFKLIRRGVEIVDFLIERGDLLDLKAIVHLDLFRSFQRDPFKEKIHWFKIQVATPKESRTPAVLVLEEIYRRDRLKTIQVLREEARS